MGYDWVGAFDPSTMPRRGALWKYMGKDVNVFRCPDDSRKGTNFLTSYSYNVMLAGAPPELPIGAHYPNWIPNTTGMITADHTGATRAMQIFNGVPMFAEEDLVHLKNVPDGNWQNFDGFENRHVKATGDKLSGAGTIGFHDGHSGYAKLPAPDPNLASAVQRDSYFTCDAM